MCELTRGTRFTLRTRAPVSIGNVTIEISQRSDRINATDARARIDARLRCTKPDRQPVDGTGAQER